jgi:hypothetical protein
MRFFARGAPQDLTDREPAPTLVSVPDLQCRVCELETENARLRLMVGELLVKNQRLREDSKGLRGHQAPPLKAVEAAG